MLRARPKSVTTTRSSCEGPDGPTSITLPLLRSRWMTPTACAASRPAAICPRMGSASAQEWRFFRATRVASDSPASSSMVRNRTAHVPSLAGWLPMSNTRQTFGWVICRARAISRLKRSTALPSMAISGRIVLSATRTRRTVSSTS
jgi:hypothetical protein